MTLRSPQNRATDYRASRPWFRQALCCSSFAGTSNNQFPCTGHWKLNHTLKNLGIIQFNVMTQFLLFTFIRNAPGLFESFGFTDVRPAFIAFTLFSAVSAPISEVQTKPFPDPPPLLRTTLTLLVIGLNHLPAAHFQLSSVTDKYPPRACTVACWRT